MRASVWKTINRVQWRGEAKKEYVAYDDFNALLDKLHEYGHLAESWDNRSEWMQPGVFMYERRGYWDHLYIGGPEGVRHIISNSFDDNQNTAAMKLGYVPDTGRRANTIEQKLFKELNGVTERQAFGYSDPQLNKCVPKQLYYINSRWIGKKITCAGKADYSSHYPASICGLMPDWSKHKRIEGTVDPSPEFPFVFYAKSGHLAEYRQFDTHEWREEDLSGDLFGNNYSKINPDKDVSILCPPSRYTLDNTVNQLYNMKQRGEEIDGMPAKAVLNSSIGYKHLRGANNTRNRLYHLAAVCIARANQKMVDLYNQHSKSILQIIVDGVIYMGSHTIGEDYKALGVLHQEVKDQSFIMRGVNQYMFIDRASGECTCCAHGGFDTDIFTDKLEDIKLWRRAKSV